MQDRKGIEQQVECLPQDVRSEAGKMNAIQPAFEPGPTPAGRSDRGASVWKRFLRWVSGMIVQDVPEDSALCEFDCQKVQCTNEEWAHCERRLARAAGELWPGTETKTSEPTPAVHEKSELKNTAEQSDSAPASFVSTK